MSKTSVGFGCSNAVCFQTMWVSQASVTAESDMRIQSSPNVLLSGRGMHLESMQNLIIFFFCIYLLMLAVQCDLWLCTCQHHAVSSTHQDLLGAKCVLPTDPDTIFLSSFLVQTFAWQHSGWLPQVGVEYSAGVDSTMACRKRSGTQYCGIPLMIKCKWLDVY